MCKPYFADSHKFLCITRLTFGPMILEFPFSRIIFHIMPYSEIERGCEAISGKNDKIARNCLVSTLDCTVLMQMSKAIWEKGFCDSLRDFEILGRQSKLFYSNRTHHTTKKMVVSFCTLHPPPPRIMPWLYSPLFYQGLKLRKRFKLP